MIPSKRWSLIAPYSSATDGVALAGHRRLTLHVTRSVLLSAGKNRVE